jgi:Tol biopolymer transport system component
MPFDVDRLEAAGSPIPVVEGVEVDAYGMATFAIAGDGSLTYLPSGARARELAWVSREGRTLTALEGRLDYFAPRIAPDGRQLAIIIDGDIWVHNPERGTRARLTFDGGTSSPVWTRDGERVAFRSYGRQEAGIDWIRADGRGQAEPLVTSEHEIYPFSWSPDGRVLACYELRGNQRDISLLPLDGDRAPTLFIEAPFNERSPSFSPDGRWIAYVSDESGRDEVYLQPYPGPGEKVLVSTDGGQEPVWCSTGGELFYRNSYQTMAVSVKTAPALEVGVPSLLFETREYLVAPGGSGYQSYDVSPDCQQFVMVGRGEVSQLHVVLNWFHELEQLVPNE